MIEPEVIADKDTATIEEFSAKREDLLKEIGKVIVGQEKVVEELLIALFSRGHCLLVGVPGLAKTLLISTLADILDLEFNRIQFTPDLMPSAALNGCVDIGDSAYWLQHQHHRAEKRDKLAR